MGSAKRMEIIFQDRIKDIEIVHSIIGIILDETSISLTVLTKSGRYFFIDKETLLEVKEWK